MTLSKWAASCSTAPSVTLSGNCHVGSNSHYTMLLPTTPLTALSPTSTIK